MSFSNVYKWQDFYLKLKSQSLISTSAIDFLIVPLTSVKDHNNNNSSRYNAHRQEICCYKKIISKKYKY